MEIKPQYCTIKPGKSFTFSISGLDQFGQEYPLDQVNWSSTCGKINEKGVFRISDGEGEYVVSAQVDNIKAESRIHFRRINRWDGCRSAATSRLRSKRI